MKKMFDEAANGILDEIIEARRTVRAFLEEPPPREAIEALIKAGLWAPYAALAVAGESRFRRFFVFRPGTPALEAAQNLIMGRMRRILDETAASRGAVPKPVDTSDAYTERIQLLAEKGHPSLRNAPYFIVVAEKLGVPPAALQSLAHCLQNMWLKATALGLAFQLISATESMSEDPGFMRLLGLPAGRFLLDGCAVGFPAAVPALPPRPDAADVTTWL
jgi:nitroreductase